jgi:hypothetical protein
LSRHQWIAGIALYLVAVSCAASTSARPAAGEASSGSQRSDLDVYEPVIRYLIRQAGSHLQTIYIVDAICSNADAPEELRACSDRFSDDEQNELSERLNDLAGAVRFVGSYEEADPNRDIFSGAVGAAVVSLGPISEHGEDLWVPGRVNCGGLCGTGSTLIVRSDGVSSWQVVGPGSSQWVA